MSQGDFLADLLTLQILKLVSHHQIFHHLYSTQIQD